MHQQRLLRTVNRDPSHWRDGKVTFYCVTGSIDPSEVIRGNVYIHVSKPLPTVETWLVEQTEGEKTGEGDKGIWMC